jgi:hypothetical protein
MTDEVRLHDDYDTATWGGTWSISYTHGGIRCTYRGRHPDRPTLVLYCHRRDLGGLGDLSMGRRYAFRSPHITHLGCTHG